MMLHHPSPAPMNVFGYENPQLLGNSMPRPMSISPASQYDSTYSGASMMDYSPVVPHDRQDDQQGAYTRPASYDYRQFSSVPVTVGYQLPVDYSAQGRLTHLDGDSNAYRYSSYASSPQDSLGSVSPGTHGMQPPLPQHQHHHHRLPSQQSHYGRHHRNSSTMEYPSSPDEHGPPSVVGQPGMPDPAPRPKGPKLKFTPEDDALLIELKETKNLTWKQIADFFPDRSAGTLQVRYCTKLKAKTTNWTDEAVQKLRLAIQEYENDKWRAIAAKVGHGLTAATCKEKFWELEAARASMNNPNGNDATAPADDPHGHYQPGA